MPVYKLNGEVYDIPDDVVADFEKDNPNATISYHAGSDEYDIPVSQRDAFLKDFPDATIGNAPISSQSPGSTKQPMLDAVAKENTGGYQPSAAEMAEFQRTINGAGRTVSSSVAAFDRKAENLRKRQGLNAPKEVKVGESGNLVEGEKRLNPETGQLESTYITAAGNEYDNKAIADEEQRQIDQNLRDERYRQTLPGQIEETIAEGERLDKEIERLREGAHGRLMDAMYGGRTEEDADQDSRLSTLLAAKRKNDERLKILEAERDDDGGTQFWRGFYDAITNPDVYSFGVTGLSDATQMLKLKQKIDDARKRGVQPEFTEEEKSLIQNVEASEYAQQVFGRNRGSMYSFGSGFAQSLPFMFEIAATGGMGGLSEVGFAAGKKAATKLATAAVEKSMIRNLGKGGKWIAEMAVKGSGALGGVTGGGLIMANTTGAAKTSADIIDRYVGKLARDNGGNLKFEDGVSLGEAIYKGQLAQAFEYGSELVGDKYIERFMPIVGDAVKRTIGKIGPENARNFLEHLMTNKFTQGMGKVMKSRYFEKGDKALNFAGVQGWFAEGMEEEANNILNAIFVGDTTWMKQDPNKPAILSTKDQLELWEQTVLTSALLRTPQTVQTAGKAAGYYGYKYATDAADANAASVFGDSNWQMIREEIDKCTNEDLPALLETVVKGGMTQKQKEATMFYADNLLKMRGYNAALAADGFDTGKDEVDELIDDLLEKGYQQGHQAELPDEQKAVADEAKKAEADLKQYGDEFAIMVTAGNDHPGNTLRYMMEHRDVFTDDQIAAAQDYYQKQVASDAMMDAALEKIDLNVSKNTAEIRSNTHTDSGQVITATDGVNTYYILGGDVETADDGSLRLVGTGGAMTVKDASTGDVMVVSPAKLAVVNAVNSDELVQNSEQALREHLVRQTDDAIDYGSPANEVFDLEDTVTLQDGDGGLIEGEIVTLPNAVDGVFVIQTGDGRALQMTSDDMNRRIVAHNGMEVQRATPQPIEQNQPESVQESPESVPNLTQSVPESPENVPAESQQPQSALDRIPVRTDASGQPLKNKKGRPILDWHKASVEDAAAALVETTGGNMVMARDTASDLVKNEQARLEKIRKQKPKGEDPIEIAESRMEIQKQVDEVQAVIKQWQDVGNHLRKQMETEAAEKRAAEEAAKSAEQKAREAEEARIRKEKQDEIDRERRRKKIEEEIAQWNKPYAPLAKARKEMESDREAMDILDRTEPETLEEWVSSLIQPQSMMWDDETDHTTGRTIVGLQSELGLQKKDIERIGGLVAPRSKGGKPFGQVVHDIWESLPEGMKQMYTDQDVRNTLIGLFGEGNTMRMRHLTEEHRIEEARQLQKENARRDAEAEMDAWAEAYHLTPAERETYEDFLSENYFKYNAPLIKEVELINQIIADEQNTRSEEVDSQHPGGTVGRDGQGSQAEVQDTSTPETPGADTQQQAATGAEADTGGEAVPDTNVSGGTPGGTIGRSLTEDEADDLIIESDRPKRVRESLEKGKLLYRFDGGAQTEQSPATVSVTTPQTNPGVESEDVIADLSEPDQSDAAADVSKPQTPGENGGETINAETQASSSEGKDTNISANLQEKTEKSLQLGKTSSPEQIAEEENRVDTNPTEGQKEAGNYQKGHIKVDGLDITIENPKGSVRSGVDADGNPWEVTMNNTYGYIRGTESVDGDHIDVFLSDDPTSGNVFVVDQVKPDGSFDEVKVMYGFKDAAEAAQAYLSNYSKGWKGLGAISGVSREAFKEWIESSHRKTKPFREYALAKREQLKNQEPEIKPSEQLKPTDLRDGIKPDTVELGAEEAKAKAQSQSQQHLLAVKDRVKGLLEKYRSLAPIQVIDINSDDDLLLISDKDEIEQARKYLKDSKLPAAYDTISKKIYIFAENISEDEVEEGFFHENLHRGLQQYYGDGLIEVAEAFWETESPTNPEGTRIRKQAISEAYAKKPEDIKEEYLVHAFAHQMTNGTVENLFPRLSAEHQEILSNILINIGYDRTKESAQRKRTGESGQEGAGEEVSPSIQDSETGRGGVTPPSADRIEDVGEEIAGARKDMSRKIAQSLDSATKQTLAELPFSKAYKKPDLKKAVEEGALRESDATFYDAFFSTFVDPNKPRVTQSEARRKKYIPDFRTNLEKWVDRTHQMLQTLKEFVEADEQQRDRMIESLLADKYPFRDAELADIEKRKEWNKDDKDIVWGDKTSPNPLWITYEVMKQMGYSPGDKVDIPYGILKANSTGTGYTVHNKKDERNGYSFPKTVEEGIDAIVWLARLKRGDTDIQHPVYSFYTVPTKSQTAENGRYRVVYGSWRSPQSREFDSKEEADAFAAKKPGAQTVALREVVKRFGYKPMFRHPLTGERIAVNDREFETEAEARQYIEDNYEELNNDLNTQLSSQQKESGPKRNLTADDLLYTAIIRGKDGRYGYGVLIDKKYANNYGMPLILKDGFASRDEAKAYADGVKDQVLKVYNEYKARQKAFTYFDTGEDSRIGEDYRNGKDVTAEDFMNAFGFRGVQFGNWTNQRDRQMAVNQAYDALLDLAKLIGVSPRALSLNGELGIAFGARGSGNFAAHYEPGEIVINLTKTKGAGSLAHEWWHALDNYFARTAGEKGGMVTDDRTLQMRQELRDAYNALVDQLKDSSYYMRSKEKGDYWGRMHEVTARLLSEWVDQQLKKRGDLNTFLSRGAKTDGTMEMNYERYKAHAELAGKEVMPFEEYKKLDEAMSGSPYPSAQEVERFSAAMQNIFDVMQEREDEETGRVALYHKLDDSQAEAPKAEPGSQDTTLRDAIVELLQDAGIDVITDDAEGQRTLDEAKGLNKAQKRAVETASLIQKEGSLADISTADGAKIVKKLESLANKLEKVSNLRKNFLNEAGKALEATQDGSNSWYKTFKTPNGEVTIRLGNHNATVSSFDFKGEKNGISIVISKRPSKGIDNNGTAHIVEYFYPEGSIRKAYGKPLADIVRSIKDSLGTGEYVDPTGLAEREEVNDTTKFFRTKDGQAYGYTYKGKIYLDPSIATAETPVHEYTHLWAEAVRQKDPKTWANIVDVLKNDPAVRPFWDKVAAQYPELTDENDIAEEVLAQYSGRRGSDRLREVAGDIARENGGIFGKAQAVEALRRMRNILARFWKAVADVLGWKYSRADEIADKVLYDLLSGVRPEAEGSSEVREQRVPDDDSWTDDVAQEMYEETLAKEISQRQERWQDAMISLKAIQDAIAAETGNVATAAEDAYRFENRMHGRAKNMSERYDWHFYQPMLKAFNDFINANGMTREQGLEYLISKSGLERNVYYAFRDAAKAKLTEDIEKARKKLEKEYAAKLIDEGDYLLRKKDIEKKEREGVDDTIKQVRETLAYQRAKEDYQDGSIGYTEYLRRIESVIRSHRARHTKWRVSWPRMPCLPQRPVQATTKSYGTGSMPPPRRRLGIRTRADSWTGRHATR